MGDFNLMPFFVMLSLGSAIVGWAVIEFIIWAFSHLTWI